jgi:hypothetical protein
VRGTIATPIARLPRPVDYREPSQSKATEARRDDELNWLCYRRMSPRNSGGVDVVRDCFFLVSRLFVSETTAGATTSVDWLFLSLAAGLRPS